MTKFFWGGGTIADTLNGVPNAIDGMLGQYKKIATIDTKIKLNTPYNRYGKTRIPLNLSFIPKLIILIVQFPSRPELKTALVSSVSYSTSTEDFEPDYNGYIDKKTITNSGFDVYFKDTSEGIELETCQIIAIE